MPGTVQISIHSGFINPAIYYTLGGSQPSFDSHLYSGPFSISATAIVRAIAYRSDFLDSQESDPITIIIPRSFELLATTDGGGAVTTTPPNAGSRYLSNAAVSIAATPTAPWVFLGWGGDASGNNNPLSINMRADTYVKAIFGTTVGTTTARAGVISISPALPAYPFATVVTLTALPSLGNYFGAWGNAASGNTNPFVFTVRTPAPTISALFSALSAGQYGLVILGAIVRVEFAAPPMGGWKIDAKGGPHLRVAAVIHKQAEGVPKLLGEHLSGRHKYAVSQEVLYSMLDSGFVVETGAGGGDGGDAGVVRPDHAGGIYPGGAVLRAGAAGGGPTVSGGVAELLQLRAEPGDAGLAGAAGDGVEGGDCGTGAFSRGGFGALRGGERGANPTNTGE